MHSQTAEELTEAVSELGTSAQILMNIYRNQTIENKATQCRLTQSRCLMET